VTVNGDKTIDADIGGKHLDALSAELAAME